MSKYAPHEGPQRTIETIQKLLDHGYPIEQFPKLHHLNATIYQHLDYCKGRQRFAANGKNMILLGKLEEELSLLLSKVEEPTPIISRHAEARMSQRGINKKAVSLIRTYGEPVQDGFLVTKESVEEARRAWCYLESKLGSRIVEINNNLITVLRPSKKRQRMLKKDECQKYKGHSRAR